MSGICGLFNLDDKPVAEAELASMTAMLEQRGPDATRQWNEGPVGLGHTLLATTPELLFERQPFKHTETGCVITADVRLDNRDQLIAALVPGRKAGSIGDAELILIAYLNWGEDCPNRLLGDFAFAVCDPRSKKLFCARDHSGMRQLYYHHAQGKRFVFATDARAILVLPEVPYRINEGRIADFLVQELEWIDYTSTFFEDVFRLPPAHKLSVTPDRFDVAEYWRAAPGPELGPMSDDDYQQGFLEVFTQAVESRLRVPSNAVCSMLSGGMDSGSVVAVAKDILKSNGKDPLRTYSGTARLESTDIDFTETRAIAAATSMPLIAPEMIYVEDLPASCSSMISGNEEPFDAPMTIHKAIYRAASVEGNKVILDGAAGDVILGEGTYILRLIREWKLRQALAEIKVDGDFWGQNTSLSCFMRSFGSVVVPESAKKLVRAVRQRRHDKTALADSLISREFADRVHIDERLARLRTTFPAGWNPDYFVERCNAVRPNMTGGRERYARVAAGAAIEASDPFMDKRVIDFCSRLPGRFRLKNGWPKIILRDIMAGRLPDDVRWCHGKWHVGWRFNLAITRKAVKNGELTLAMLREDLREYVDETALTKAWKTFQEGGSAGPIHSAYALSVWLKEFSSRPVVPNRQFDMQ